MGELTIGAIVFMAIVWVLVLGTVVVSLKRIVSHEKKTASDASSETTKVK